MCQALQAVHEGKLEINRAAMEYSVPQTTGSVAKSLMALSLSLSHTFLKKRRKSSLIFLSPAANLSMVKLGGRFCY